MGVYMISAIAAMSKNRVLGMNGKIPWHIKGEQSRFRELTSGKTIIMGRRSYEEIGRPLPNRRTILISTKLNIQENNCVTVACLAEALKLTEHEDEVFISGGGQVYEEALPFLDRIYLTVIEKEYDGDIYFPVFDMNIYRKTYEHRIEGEIPYTYYTYDKYLV
jgi:dihydrofolate reductase/dihydrofolate reductase (trimethoprim resistance protein)